MPAVKSKAQARFYGAVAGGTIHVPGLSAKKAQEDLKGKKLKKLPAKVKKKK